MPKAKTLVTSALPYVNNLPHLGTMVCVISADVYTRYLRLAGHPVLSVLGTDEHGTTTEVKALEEGVTPREVCDKYFKLQKEIYDWFHCDFDCFGRSSSKENVELSQEIFLDLHKGGFIIEKELEQAYCETDKRFLADRFVEGTCPHCAYEHARGDQCENCGKLLESTQLKKPRCKICKKTPVVRKTKHLFMDLPKAEPALKKWMTLVRGKWSANAASLTDAWMKEGLQPRCITRDLKWGVPVPLKGYEDKVFYSWFDAPIAYIGITKESKKHWDQWWQDPKDTRLVQFMGKDNIPFHTILFPGFLLGTGKPWTLVDELSVNEFLNYEGGQFSKSRNIGVFGDHAKDTGIPADVWRYYLMMNRPEKSDTEFSWDDLAAKLNNEVVANFANLVFRVLSFVNRSYDNVVPPIILTDTDKHFLKQLEEQEEKIRSHYEKIELKDALKEIMHLSKMANQYFQGHEPWKLVNTDAVRAGTVVGVLVNVIKDLSILLWPVMPAACEQIRHVLGVADVKPSWDDLALKALDHGSEIEKATPLFTKIDPKAIEELRKKYGGKSNVFPLNLKVGVVLDVKPHPEADRLYVLTVDLGEKKTRTIVAGLREHYAEDALKGKHLVVVSNLQPAKLRGVVSEGMVLAASKKEVVKALMAPKAKAGTSVTVLGMESNTAEIMYEEFAKLKLHVHQGQVFNHDKVLVVGNESLSVDMSDGSKVS